MQTPLAELTDQGWQLVIPGTERISQRKHCHSADRSRTLNPGVTMQPKGADASTSEIVSLSVAAIEDSGHNPAETGSQGEPMPAKKKGRPRTRQPAQPATVRGKVFQEGLSEAGFTVATFAARCGIFRQTVHRWIAEDTVPPWAAWLLDLLLERRQIAAKLEQPAE
jgi:hypothetical protein